MAAWLRLIRFSKHKVQAPVRTLIFRGAWMTAAIAWLEPVSAQPKQFPAVERSSSVGGLHFKEHSGIHPRDADGLPALSPHRHFGRILYLPTK
ncbi:MAG TPA: hypothetical protein EYM25_04465 [Deltaproteobacteria bacterium]|nr:hypothetical protein [Deltaproteobacteria bacterium]